MTLLTQSETGDNMLERDALIQVQDNPEEPPRELDVSFGIPLVLLRQTWVLNVLRREKVREVLDVGCGEGAIVGCLCIPAPWLPDKAYLELDVPDTGSARFTPGWPMFDPQIDVFLHVRRVHALDISADELECVVSITAPPKDDQPDAYRLPRWEPLEVKVWEGGLQVFNPELVGVECIVATEVIEHLSEDVLPIFAPTLLGLYHPRLLLVTTPSYTYNARWYSPNMPEAERSGYRDPTGRTGRVFRHHDHKFEWTVEEFSAWCGETAKEWGYSVDVSGVGKASEPDEWGRDEVVGFASQVALFTRREGEVYAAKRIQKCNELRQRKMTKGANMQPHKQLATHHHPVGKETEQPGEISHIVDLAKTSIALYGGPNTKMDHLWQDVARACGGSFDVLVDAVEQCEDIYMTRDPNKRMEDWSVCMDDVKVAEIRERYPQGAELDERISSPAPSCSPFSLVDPDSDIYVSDAEYQPQQVQDRKLEGEESEATETNVDWGAADAWGDGWGSRDGWGSQEGWGSSNGWPECHGGWGDVAGWSARDSHEND